MFVIESGTNGEVRNSYYRGSRIYSYRETEWRLERED